MKTVGFVDYYLDEWHADNYPAWIKESKANNSGYEAAYAWGEKKSPGGISSESWCKKHNIVLCASIREVCEKSDALVVLAPDNAEKHLEYAKKVLPFGKKTYIDKTFANTLKEAKEIFRIAKKHKTPLCSSSALRFASEIAEYKGNGKSIITFGSGPSFETYAVHQLEMIVKVMGTNAEKLMAVQTGVNVSIVIEFKGGRRAVYNQFVGTEAPFAVSVKTKGEKAVNYRPIESEFFMNFIDALLDFFENGKPMAGKKETLAVIALIEAANKALKKPDRWIKVGDIS